MHYKVLVCDDDKEVTQKIVTILNQYADLYNIDIVGFYNANDLFEYCRGNRYDIIYMDIEIGKDNGLSIAKSLKLINPNTLIIYVSSYGNYYVEMVQAEPFHFIFKDFRDMPAFDREVANTLELAMKRIHRKKVWSFEFKRERYYVEIWRIKYFYSFARKIYIVGNLEADMPNYFYGKLDDLYRELEMISDDFGRINKRYIVNMRYVRYSGTTRIKVGDEILSFSIDYYDDFEKKMKKYGKLGY